MEQRATMIPEQERKLVSSLDKQEGGDHYDTPIQPIEYIVANQLPYREGNVVKYVSRHHKKGGASDIRKAIHYLEMILEDYDVNEEESDTPTEAEEPSDMYDRSLSRRSFP